MRSIIRRAGIPTLAHHLWRRPRQALGRLIAAGGPLAVYRTERGRREMEAAARELPSLPATGTESPVTLHLLTGRNFWYQTAFCLWSFARQSGRLIHPVLYDDGTLDPSCRERLARIFPAVNFVDAADTIDRLNAHLPLARFPALRDRWLHYPNIRKLIDPHLTESGWKLVTDSDLLFFRPPTLLLDWAARPERPFHAVDCETSYGYSRALMTSLAGGPIAERVNVGLIGLDSSRLDWDRLESWCQTLLTREGPNYYLEQALVAMLLVRTECVVAPAGDYVTLPEPPEAIACRAVMHHYVAHSKRWYFQSSWRKVLAGARQSPALP
ncbi:MAG TPA: glycosyl transferase family 2 [Candidatus Didemnitutus sp.]|jgi:hypothetical protein